MLLGPQRSSRKIVVRMDEAADRHDRFDIGTGSGQRSCGALRPGPGCVGVVDDQHSLTRYVGGHPEAEDTGAQMPERLAASGQQLCKAKIR